MTDSRKPHIPDDGANMAAPSLCWACRHTVHSEHFCPECAKVQPLPEGVSYFELFEVPVSLKQDEAELERRYHKLSRMLHPDFFQQKTGDERGISLARFAAINRSYQTIRTLRGRARYLLELFRFGEGENRQEETPKSLLMTVFELQEAIEELTDLPEDSTDSQREACRKRVREIGEELDEKEAAIDEGLQALAESWDKALAEEAADPVFLALLGRVKQRLDEYAYLDRLRTNVRRALGED